MVKRKKRKKILKRRKLLFSILWFLVKLNILVIPLYLLLVTNFSLPPLQNFLALALGNTLNFLGYQATVEGYYIGMVFGFTLATFEINMDCTAWKSMYLLAALAIASPAKQKKKLKFLAIAIPFLFIMNFIRILTTILLAFQYGFQYLNIVHTFLWREGMIFIVLAVWYIWFRRINYKRGKMKIPFRWKFV